MSYSPLTVANTFIDLAQADGIEITNMKLQKLLYFAEGHYVAHRDKRLLDESPRAWRYGPVYRSVYGAFQYCGSDPIRRHAMEPFPDEDDNEVYSTVGPQKDREFIKSVWNAYKHKTAAQLSTISHNPKGPWAKTRELGLDEAIEPELINEYFTSLRRRAEENRQDA